MSIFDSILGDMSSLDNVLGGIGAAATAKDKSSNAKSDQYYEESRLLSLMNRLDYGTQKQSANPAPGQYGVTKSQPVTSVDPAEEQSRWINRLNQYLNIVPAPQKGAK